MKKQVTFVSREDEEEVLAGPFTEEELDDPSPAVKQALIEIAKTYTESLASCLGVKAEFDREISREGIREKLRG